MIDFSLFMTCLGCVYLILLHRIDEDRSRWKL